MSIDHSEKFFRQAAGMRAHGLGNALRHWIDVQRLRWQIKRERRALAGLSDTLLADMGIDRAEAMRESRRSLRDIPAERIYRQLGKHWLMDLD